MRPLLWRSIDPTIIAPSSVLVEVGATVALMTSREKLHVLIDELTDVEVEAALARLVKDREQLNHWAQTEDSAAVQDAWALANARDAIRDERW